MMNISRLDKSYSKTKYEILKVDKSLIMEPEDILNNNEEINEDNNYGKIEKIQVTDKKTKKNYEIEFRKIKHKENDDFQKVFINKGPYETTNIDDKIDKKKDQRKKSKKKPFTVY